MRDNDGVDRSRQGSPAESAKRARMMAHLRRRAAASQLTDVLIERQRRGFTNQAERAASIIRMTRAARAAGRISFEQYISGVGHMAEHISEGRWVNGQYDAELAPLSAAMKDAEARMGLSADEAFQVAQGPEDYEAANRAYECVLDRCLGAVFLSSSSRMSRKFGDATVMNIVACWKSVGARIETPSNPE